MITATLNVPNLPGDAHYTFNFIMHIGVEWYEEDGEKGPLYIMITAMTGSFFELLKW